MVSDGRSYCRDGTITYSSGKGTCSWHKGQGMQPEKKPILYISLFLLLCWAGYFYARDEESTIFQNLDKHISHIAKNKIDDKLNFNGYSPDTPKEVIIQLLMRVTNPASELVINELCKTFKVNREDAIKISNEAIRRKEKNDKQ